MRDHLWLPSNAFGISCALFCLGWKAIFCFWEVSSCLPDCDVVGAGGLIVFVLCGTLKLFFSFSVEMMGLVLIGWSSMVEVGRLPFSTLLFVWVFLVGVC